jgi:glycosyltransferase involved in cell wall biosynthesis
MKIAVCTPTYNRRWAWEWSKLCFDRQDYPDLVWIVVDNSDTPEQSWEVSNSHSKVRYTHVSGKRPIGELRNICITEALKTSAEYIAFWDDDDFYVPHRFTHAINMLNARPDCQYVGCSELLLLLVKENVIIKVGPYGENHSTAASWVMRRPYAEKNSFDPNAVKAEEGLFMCNWRTKMVTIEPSDCILVMGHSGNTVDKSQVRTKAAQFMSKDINTANGKMVARMQWFKSPEVWARFQSTFFGASNGKPQASTLEIPTVASVVYQTPHTGASVASAEYHACIPQPSKQHLPQETTLECQTLEVESISKSES